MTQAAGQPIDAAGACEGVHERASHEVIPPEDVFLRIVGKRSLEDRDQFQHDRIKVLVHQLRAFRRIADAGAERSIVHPQFPTPMVEIKVGIEKGVQRAFNRNIVAGFSLVAFQRFHAPPAGDARAPGKDRFEQVFLVVEVVVEKSRMNAHPLGHVAQGNPMKPVLGKQVPSGIEDLFDALRSLLGLRPPTPFCLWLLGHCADPYLTGHTAGTRQLSCPLPCQTWNQPRNPHAIEACQSFR